MRKKFLCGLIIMATVLLFLLRQTAFDPENFSGEWYCAKNQSIYQFSDGIIYSQKYSVTLSDGAAFSGAYSFCRDSVILFALGVDGLDSVKELYLVKNNEGTLLCDSRDGAGEIYFFRDSSK